MIYFGATWGINADFINPEAAFYVPLFRPSFYLLTGILSMGLFIHNAILTIVKANVNQENNVSVEFLAVILICPISNSVTFLSSKETFAPASP